jgi:hypothetical protein
MNSIASTLTYAKRRQRKNGTQQTGVLEVSVGEEMMGPAAKKRSIPFERELNG